MRVAGWASIATIIGVACTPNIEGAFDDSAYNTLIVGAHAPGEPWTPLLFDLSGDRGRVVYPWSSEDPPPLAYWAEKIDDLRLEVPLRAADAKTCSALRLPLSDATVVCQRDVDRVEDAFGPCAEDARWRVEDWAVTMKRWPDPPDPCTRLMSFDRFSVINFDVQTTVMGSFGDVTAGAGTIVAPVGPGQVVLGQLSGWSDGPFARTTEIGLFATADVRTSMQAPRPRTSTITRTEWTAGARRADGVAWLGSEHTALGSFDGSTGRITVDVPPIHHGRVVDMASDPSEPERVYAATSSCSLHLREPGSRTWTTLIPPIAGLHWRRALYCVPRVQVVGPAHALITGLPGTLPHEAPPTAMFFGTRLDRLVEVRGDRVAAIEMPWPTLSATISRSLRGVATFTGPDGEDMALVGAAQYTRLYALDTPPFDFGAGEGLFFVRTLREPDAAWTPIRAEPVEQDGMPHPPVLIGDIHELSFTTRDDDLSFRGVVIGAHTNVHVFDPVRAARNAESAIVVLDHRWQPMGYFPLVQRVRPDGDGGFVIATGDILFDGRVDLQRRFHWWRPIDP